MEALHEMLKVMLEDRQKRDEEIAEEHRRHEEEFLAERERAKEDSLRREKEMQEKMNSMQTRMESLMKLVETSSKKEVSPPKELSVKLVPLTEKDDIESYLVMFERIMEAHKIDIKRWTQFLAPNLTGKAQQAFAALPAEEAAKYKELKGALLTRYDISEKMYRRRFRSDSRKVGESNRVLAVRLMDWQGKWLKECKQVKVMELARIEQFLNGLPTEKRLCVSERKPKTCILAGELADEYEQARRKDLPPQQKSNRKEGVKCHYCAKAGHIEKCRKKMADWKEKICFHCRKPGHLACHCPEKTEAGSAMLG